MKIKTSKTKMATLMVATAIAGMAHSSGVYFVSGGDFRKSDMKYVLETTNENESVEVTPWGARPLSIWKNNTKYAGPWQVKTDGEEIEYGVQSAIRQKTGSTAGGPIIDGELVFPTSGGGGVTNAAPWKHVYANPGRHLVKIYDFKNNLYLMSFSYMTNMVSLHIDWKNHPAASLFYTSMMCYVQNNPNLTKLYVRYPNLVVTLQGIDTCFALKDVTIENPEQYTAIGNNTFWNCPLMECDMVFTNVTSVGYNVFRNTSSVKYVSLPKATTFGQMAIFNPESSNPSQMTVVRIGDGITNVGKSVLEGHVNLETIEFATNESNWVDVWNNHAILPSWLGTIALIEGEIDKATLTPAEYDSSRFANANRRPGTMGKTITVVKVDK